MRGTGVLVALNTQADNNYRILNQQSSQFLSFSKSVTSTQSYPTSLMGAMALLRQMYHDAKWYEAGNSNTKDLSLEALNKNKQLPQIFDAGDKFNGLRAAKIGNEFGINYIIKGSGNEYQAIQDIAATKATYIIPLDFPDAYDVTDPYQANKVSLGDMRHWNQAPANASVLAQNGVNFALTTANLRKASDFNANLLKAISYGLNKTKALEALTTIPAQLLGKSNEIGTLKNGALANFLITSGDVFENSTTLYENWVQGNKHIVNDMNVKDIRGEYTLRIAGNQYSLSIKGSAGKPVAELMKDSTKIASKFSYSNDWVQLFYTPEGDGKTEFVRLTAPVTDTDNLNGTGTLTNGNSVQWSAVKTAPFNERKKSEKTTEIVSTIPVTFPNKAFGFSEKPQQQTLLFKNATVWTNEAEGIMKNTDVLIRNGKIAQIGQNLNVSGATVIDATGKHLTNGIIDEHSHIATAAVNESGHNSSAEVTIEDVVNLMI